MKTKLSILLNLILILFILFSTKNEEDKRPMSDGNETMTLTKICDSESEKQEPKELILKLEHKMKELKLSLVQSNNLYIGEKGSNPNKTISKETGKEESGEAKDQKRRPSIGDYLKKHEKKMREYLVLNPNQYKSDLTALKNEFMLRKIFGTIKGDIVILDEVLDNKELTFSLKISRVKEDSQKVKMRIKIVTKDGRMINDDTVIKDMSSLKEDMANENRIVIDLYDVTYIALDLIEEKNVWKGQLFQKNNQGPFKLYGIMNYLVMDEEYDEGNS
tara:strand:- start:755 stop:1579 length:825 start_codon:yes stop_codon:yes gene_type:complete